MDRLDRYCRQGYKTTWKLNESVVNQPWTAPKNMGGMGYTTTLTILAHTLHAHGDRCMRRTQIGMFRPIRMDHTNCLQVTIKNPSSVTKDIAYHTMDSDLHRVMKEWLRTSKEELIREEAVRTWDETVDNVWHRLATCDHLLDLKSWKKGEPPPGQGVSYDEDTRHLRILRQRLEEVMGKSARDP